MRKNTDEELPVWTAAPSSVSSTTSTIAAAAAAKLSVYDSPNSNNLRRMSPSMRRSVPSLPNSRHMSASSNGHFEHRQARSFNASSSVKDYRATSANSSHSAPPTDPRHVRVTIEKRGSKGSIFSVGPAGDGSSRPISADSVESTSSRPRKDSNSISLYDGSDASFGSTTTPMPVHTTIKTANTRIVAPNNPQGGRPMPPPIKRQNTVPDLRRPRSHYVGELVWDIDETVYCGGLEAAFNLNLLCRLNIEYIVDLSGLDEDNMPRAKRGECPCLCSRPTAHSRALMAINIDEYKTQDLTPYFKDVISFIDKAKTVNKCVLIHCQNGRNLAPAFVCAYLMRLHKIGRIAACDMVAGRCPNVAIHENIHKSLRKWEAQLGVSDAVSSGGGGAARRPSEDGSGPNNRLSVPLFTTKRSAWT
uniref:protein-tyrosine-phosphatase n=1 Tax=Plectus sambesii TaxID=2011161 RepID=A0A914WVA9_9BILA